MTSDPQSQSKSSHPASSTADLAQLLSEVATGRQSVAAALTQLTGPFTAAPSAGENGKISSATETSAAEFPIEHVNLDLDRQRRCGFPEVIYGEGKPAEMIGDIILKQREAGQDSLATRVAPTVAQSVLTRIEDCRFNPQAKTLCSGSAAKQPPCPLAFEAPDPPAHVAVVTAGSTDAPVAEEAVETLHWMRIPFRRFDDIGVAGPARLLAAVPLLRQADAVVVIAGMEGALPAAMGGHLDVPLFAVPTSVGYGATLGGLTPLMGMLSSCASNVAVVNIDAGFKAAYLAGMVARTAAR